MNSDEYFMAEALKLAKISRDEREVPVGALIVKDGILVSAGRNRRELGKNALYHAEIEAINNACKKLNSWRLTGCAIYVTLEPCPMCAGAIINSRIERLIYGASDYKSGSCGSVINLFDYPYNHSPEVTSGVLHKECSSILTDFFKSLRDK
jgi:tRNA(adenine34) deaminase